MESDVVKKLAARCSKMYPFCMVMVLVLLSCLACQPYLKTSKPHDEVRLQIKWIHQAQFAGFYLAKERGYYDAEDINITFLEGGPDVDIVQRLTSGQAGFAVIAPETIFAAHGRGEPIVAIAAINRRSPVVYVADAASGIVRPGDFLGRTVSTLDTSGSQQDMQVQFFAMMSKLQLDVSKVKIVPWDSNYTGFYSGEVNVTPCYATSALVKMRQKGMKLNLIWPSDYGVHFYSDMLVTTETMISDNPALVTRFLRASLRGWQDAIEDYQQAVAVSLQYTGNKNAAFHTAMMEAMLPLINTGVDQIGWMKPGDWQDMYEMLRDQGLLSKAFDVREIYTTRFLEEIYRGRIK